MTSTPSSRRARRRIRLWLIAVLVGCVAVVPSAAWGSWQDDVTLTTTATAGQVAPPQDLTCTTRTVLLVSQAVISWQEPPSGPPDRYIVRAEANGTTYTVAEVAGDVRELAITSDLLTGLLEGLLQLILGGLRPPVTVAAAHDSGWESAPTQPVQIRQSLLGLGGLRCV